LDQSIGPTNVTPSHDDINDPNPQQQGANPEFLVRSSFHQFQQESATPALEQEAEELEEEARGYGEGELAQTSCCLFFSFFVAHE